MLYPLFTIITVEYQACRGNGRFPIYDSLLFMFAFFRISYSSVYVFLFIISVFSYFIFIQPAGHGPYNIT